jgi:hypothetical protein
MEAKYKCNNCGKEKTTKSISGTNPHFKRPKCDNADCIKKNKMNMVMVTYGANIGE